MKEQTTNIIDKTTAKAACADELQAKMGEAFGDTEKVRLDEAVDQIYEAYEQGGEVPRKEALVDALRNNSDDISKLMANIIEGMETDPFLPKQTKKKRLVAIIAGIVVLALIGGGIAYAVNSQPKPEAEPEKVETVAEEPEEELGTVTATVKAEGYDKETSTPVSLEVYEGDVKEKLMNDDETDDPKPMDEVSCNANEAIEIESLTEEGTYTVAVSAAPILEDGTVYEASEPQIIELHSDNINLTFECTVMNLEEATEEEIEEVTEAATKAAEKSDNKSASNAATNATKKATEKATSAKSSSGSSSSNKSNSSSSSSSNNKNNSTSSNSNSSSSSSGSSSSSSSGSSSKPTHTHNWVAVTKTVHHDAQLQSVYVCNSCGAEFTSGSALDSHLEQGALNDTCTKGYHTYQKTIKSAYDETVTTGYKCSGCGATK